MAKAPTPSGFEPEAQYLITVSKVVEAPGGGGMFLRPSSPRIVVSGAVAEVIKDAIATSEKIG